MRRLLMVSALLALVLASAGAFGQDIVNPPQEKWFYGGFLVDTKPVTTLKFTGGTAVPLAGQFWLIPQFSIGEYDSLTRTSSVSSDVAWKAYNHRFGSAYLLLSPGVDWVNTPGGATAYINGAVGGFVSVKVCELLASGFGWDNPTWNFLRERVALYGGYRYKEPLKKAGWYPEGSQIGFGIAIRT